MVTMPIDKRDIAEGARMSPALAWLFVVPSCPMQIAVALPAAQAGHFIGALVLGCALICMASLAINPRHKGRPCHLTALLPLGMTAAALLSQLSTPCAASWAGACGCIAGLGEGAALLAWGRRLSTRSTASALAVLATVCTCGAAIVTLLGALSFSPAAVRVLLVVIATTSWACLPRMHGNTEPESPTSAAPPIHMANTVRRLWEPALGLGLSLMSAILPWGSFIAGSEASVPSCWSFAIGAFLTGALLLCMLYTLDSRIGFDVAIHIALPLLATAVVALRLVGDIEEFGKIVSAIKGVGSGIASTGFLICAWTAMAREARLANNTHVPFALGLGSAFLIAFAILPLHATSQAAASLLAPFLSLAFLALTCCSSIVHLRRRAEAQQPCAPAPGIEEAADELARRYALSPREAQVLHQLVLGRSAESIGSILGISPNTVRSHVGNIHGKLDIRSRDQLADLIEEARRSLT